MTGIAPQRPSISDFHDSRILAPQLAWGLKVGGDYSTLIL